MADSGSSQSAIATDSLEGWVVLEYSSVAASPTAVNLSAFGTVNTKSSSQVEGKEDAEDDKTCGRVISPDEFPQVLHMPYSGSHQSGMKRRWYEQYSSSSIESDEGLVASRMLLRDRARSCNTAAEEIFLQQLEDSDGAPSTSPISALIGTDTEEGSQPNVNTASVYCRWVECFSCFSIFPIKISVRKNTDNDNNRNDSVDFCSCTTNGLWSVVCYRLKQMHVLGICICATAAASLCVILWSSPRTTSASHIPCTCFSCSFVTRGATCVQFLMISVGPLLRIGETFLLTTSPSGEWGRILQNKISQEVVAKMKEEVLKTFGALLTRILLSFLLYETKSEGKRTTIIKAAGESDNDAVSTGEEQESADKVIPIDLKQQNVRVGLLLFLCVGGVLVTQYVFITCS